MKILLLTALLGTVLTLCGLTERLKSLSSGSNTASNSTSGPTKTDGKTSDAQVEQAKMTSEQQAIADAATETKWDDQGISWRLPAGWKKTDMKKENALFSSSDGAFLIPTVSVMPDDFPSDVSLKATYDSALQQLKNGKYESVKYVEIDGVKGVEWLENMPEDKIGPRRHQWIAFRNYLGQNQQLNIMLSTKGSNFDKHRTDFPAIMYSMKIGK
ncbi:MAG: hypothetical protein HOP17_16040 [Acidobacteria bacterium]|nr:hypothetical protein [Acidobacteriota bacterium]